MMVVIVVEVVKVAGGLDLPWVCGVDVVIP
jgi:hypothetical protein